MAERGFLFKAPLIRALLSGQKTQTRRLFSPYTAYVDGGPSRPFWSQLDFTRAWVDNGPSPAGNPGPYLRVPRNTGDDETVHRVYPRVFVGDTIWARETWYHDGDPSDATQRDPRMLEYRADHDCRNWEAGCPCNDDNGRSSWRSALHLPRWASRITLDVTEVRIQRLQDISEEDARAEGVPLNIPQDLCIDLRAEFREVWDRINDERSPWERNDWVIAYSFRKVEQSAEKVAANA